MRAFLVAFYLELEDVSAARDVVTEQPSVQPLQWLPICLFVGASERGAESGSRESRAHSCRQCRSSEAYLVRDAALASGRLDDARNEILLLLDRQNEFVDLSATMTLAQLSIATGDRREGERLAREMLDS